MSPDSKCSSSQGQARFQGVSKHPWDRAKHQGQEMHHAVQGWTEKSTLGTHWSPAAGGHEPVGLLQMQQRKGSSWGRARDPSVLHPRKKLCFHTQNKKNQCLSLSWASALQSEPRPSNIQRRKGGPVKMQETSPKTLPQQIKNQTKPKINAIREQLQC